MPLGPFAPIPPREKIRRSHINDLRTALTGIQDAYDVAVANGFTGTRGQWLDSLKGEKGDPGAGLAPIGSAETVDDLPSDGNTVGDVRTVDADGRAYRWDGSAWVDIGAFRGPGGIDTDLRAIVGTQRYDVRDYGSVGTSDDSATFAAAASAAQTAGGGIVTAPAGEYTFLAGLPLYDGVYYEFPGSGSTHLDFSGVTAPITNCAITGSGSLTALPALAANIARHGRAITFASAPDVAVGDILVIYDSADGSFNPARSYYRAGEFVRVIAVSGSTVTLATRTYAGYDSGGTVSVYKMTPIRTGVRGARMTFTAGVTGIKVSLGSGLRFDDLILRHSDMAHLELDRCYGVGLRAIDAWDAQAAVGHNYGVKISNSQSIDVDGCFLETTRHGLTTSGTDVVGCVPCREITVRGGRISGLDTANNSMGCDMHGNIEYASFLGVQMPYGCMIAGDHTSIRGGFVHSGPTGAAIVLREPVGWSHEIDTAVELTTDITTNVTGAIDLSNDATANITRTGGLLQIRGTLDMHGYKYSSTTIGVYIYNRSTTAYANDVDIDMDIRSDVSGATVLALWLRAVTSSGFRTADVSVRSRGGEVYVNCSPETLTIHDCDVVESSRYGLRSTAITTPAYTDNLIRSRNNRVTKAQNAGILYALSGTSAGRIESDNDEATNCNQSGSSANDSATSVYLNLAKTVIYRRAVVGDNQSVPTQTYRDYISTVGTLIEEDILDIGTVATQGRTSITTRHFRGRGAGAPDFVAAVGSQYHRLDGGAGTTMYVNETGTSTWRAV